VYRNRNERIRQEEVEHLRDILREHESRRQAEFYESLKPRPRSRDRIQSLEDAIAQLEGIMRQQELNRRRIEDIQKSLDRLRYELNRVKNMGPKCE
jgi:DNA-directed RNA polymerase alpha subunit